MVAARAFCNADGRSDVLKMRIEDAGAVIEGVFSSSLNPASCILHTYSRISGTLDPDHHPITMFDSIALRDCSKSAPVSCI